jgi:VWFA-related protein
MSKPIIRFATLLSFILIAILSGSSPAQSGTDQKTASQEKPGTVYESATVLKAVSRLVVVDVVVTNKKGEPITGLAAKDFTLMEDGAPQSVRFFSFQGDGNSAQAGNSAPPPGPPRKLPSNVVTNIPDYKPGSAMNVILLDALNSDLANQASMREQLIKFIATVPADRPTAIYALGKKLWLLQDFTSDPNVLQTVIRNYKGGISDLLANPTGAPPSDPLGMRFMPEFVRLRVKQFLKETISTETDLRVNATMEALIALARTLAAYPGRKNLIWLSEAFPLVIEPDSTVAGRIHTGNVERNYDVQIARTADALMNAQIALYPIDIRGIASSDVFKANMGVNNYGESFISGAGTQRESREFSDELQAAHSTMTDLAERTGGKAFYDTNDFGKAVRSSMDDGSTYYTLSYYPSDKNWNGKFRKIKLRVKLADAKLRYRLGYFAIDPSIYQERSAALRAQDFGQTLSLDYPVSTALIFKAGVMPPSAKTHDKVAVNYVVDAHAISFQKQEDGLQHAILSGAVQVYSEKGEPVKTEATTITTALTPEVFRQVMQHNLPFQMSFDLPPGKYLLRLGIRDDRTGLTGSANATVVVN